MQLINIFEDKNKKYLFYKLIDNKDLLEILKYTKANLEWNYLTTLSKILHINYYQLLNTIIKESYNKTNTLKTFKILDFKKDNYYRETLQIKYLPNSFEQIIDSCIKRNDLLKNNKWVEKWRMPIVWD